jgi:hypothetical protein
MNMTPDDLREGRKRLTAEIAERVQKQGESTARLEKSLLDLQRQIKASERRHLISGNTSEATFREVMTEFRAEEA